MTVIYPLDVPLEEFSEVDISEVNVSSLQVSTFTGRETVQEFEGDYWRATLRYRNLSRELAQPVTAFLSALRGSSGTFVVRYPGYGSSLGAAKDIPSSPIVDGGGQAGSDTIAIKSAPLNQTGWLLAGDIIQVGAISRPHWHRVLNDVNTDVLGRAVIDVWPRVRSGTIDNDPVLTDSPLCLFRLRAGNPVSIRPPLLYDIVVECRESTE